MITHWDEVDGQSARARAHRRLLAGAHGLQLDHRWGAAHLGRRRPLGDAVASRRLGGGDLLCPLGHGLLLPGRRRRRAGVSGRPWRLPRPPCARACPHDRRRRRRARGARVRPAALRRQHAAPAGRRVVARPDLGAAGSSGGPPVGAGSCRRSSHLDRALRPSGATLPTSTTFPRTSTREQPSATSRGISAGPSNRSGRV